MLVSHESPISMLDESRNYNDYDYALVHLFEKEPEYYNFFKVSKTLGREVLLDNSISVKFDFATLETEISKIGFLLLNCIPYLIRSK